MIPNIRKEIIVLIEKRNYIKNLDNILGLLYAAGGGPSGRWCILDKKGSTAYVSSGLSSLIQIEVPQVLSLFQFNPEWSFMKWQEVTLSLEIGKSELLDGKFLSQEGDVQDCNIQLIPFLVEDEVLVLYKILCPTDDISESITSVEVPSKNLAIQEEISRFNYDASAPNPVIYFDNKGVITYANPKMLEYNSPIENKINAEDLFLESELGPLLSGLRDYPEKGRELVVRMIMKGNPGMVDGYGRISFHTGPYVPAQYRLEFLLSEDMQLVDQPLENAMEELDRLRNEVEGAKSLLMDEHMNDFSFENIVTKSPRYKSVLRQVAQVADTNTTVLITGETGTGKELLCNATYRLSDRSDQIIVKVNCASIPSELFESILFGHEKGSFTGADSQKIGKFEMANGGTIFLDEIGEMPLEMQSKLLRVLQEGEIERIGNPEPIKIDVRIIAATNRNLEKMSKDGTFRSDLYYRLNVFPIYNIPLKDRLEDVPLLISHFIEKVNKKTGKNVTKIRNKDLEVLKKYQYPGNVRELENIIERSIILATGDELKMDFFYKNNSEQVNENSNFFSYDEMVKDHFIKALKHVDGKVTGEDSASQLLGLNGKTFASKLRKYGIDPKDYKS